MTQRRDRSEASIKLDYGQKHLETVIFPVKDVGSIRLGIPSIHAGTLTTASVVLAWRKLTKSTWDLPDGEEGSCGPSAAFV
ncbi:hypothetical protein SAMN05444714_1416 [Yoonia litorea]|uniref:Uncharacterized protein n=1 Tax=Yoonia litorea TaxID=1123755 RepID=A0A1I6M9U8_9RHOB|nr:hypothetical protein SAMN05444714_1416 [Yoonia litorea]